MRPGLAAAGTLPVGDGVRGSSPRYPPGADPRRSPQPAARVRAAREAQTRGPRRAPRGGRAARTPLETGAAPPAAIARGSPPAPGQPVSRRRPLARRRFSTLRPPFVDMRSRNPCVFARRRRFGWNVRFTTSSWCASCAQPAHPTDAPQTASSGGPLYPVGEVGCRLKDPRAMVGRSVRSGVRAPAVPGARTGPMGRAANPVRQATTAGLPGVIHRRG